MTEHDALRRALERIEDIDVDTLAEFALEARREGSFLLHFAGLAETELRRRMKAADVRELPTAEVLVSIGPPSRTYNWDVDRLEREIKPHLLKGEWEAYVTVEEPKPPRRKVATRPFLNLLKRRGLEDMGLACADIVEEDGKIVLKEIADE